MQVTKVILIEKGQLNTFTSWQLVVKFHQILNVFFFLVDNPDSVCIIVKKKKDVRLLRENPWSCPAKGHRKNSNQKALLIQMGIFKG